MNDTVVTRAAGWFTEFYDLLETTVGDCQQHTQPKGHFQ